MTIIPCRAYLAARPGGRSICSTRLSSGSDYIVASTGTDDLNELCGEGSGRCDFAIGHGGLREVARASRGRLSPRSTDPIGYP